MKTQNLTDKRIQRELKFHGRDGPLPQPSSA